MTQRILQRGSGHVVIAIGLVLVIICLLGWIFWQNLLNQGSEQLSNLTKNEPLIENNHYVVGSIDKEFGTQLDFEYPSDWQYNTTIVGEKGKVWQEIITVTSPSGKYRVNYEIGQGGGIGGSCESNGSGSVTSFSYDVLPAYQQMSLVKYTTDNVSSGNQPKSVGSLFKTDQAKKIMTGDSTCELYFGGVVTLKEGNLERPAVLLLDGSIDDTGDATIDVDTSLFADEYSQAQAILLSTKH